MNLKQTDTPIEQAPEQPTVVHPARFDDSVALKTAWTPVNTEYNGNIFSGKLVKTTPHRLECKLDSRIYLFCGAFIFTGIVALFFAWWLGILFMLAGAGFFYVFSSPWVLDRQQGQFWRTRKPEKGKTACSLFGLHALQLISKTVRDNEGDKLTIYELNGVFSDGKRILFLENNQPRTLWKNAEEIARFLKLPLWDGTGKFQQLAYTPTAEEPTLVRVPDPQQQPFPWWELLFPNITLLLGLWLLQWDSAKIIWGFFLEIAMIFVASLFRPSVDAQHKSAKLKAVIFFVIFYGASVGVMYMTLHLKTNGYLETNFMGEVSRKKVIPLLMQKPSELWFLGTALLFLFGHCLTLFAEYFRGGIRSIDHEKNIAAPMVLCFLLAVLGSLMSAQFDSVWAILIILMVLRILATLISHWIQQYKRKHY